MFTDKSLLFQQNNTILDSYQLFDSNNNLVIY